MERSGKHYSLATLVTTTIVGIAGVGGALGVGYISTRGNLKANSETVKAQTDGLNIQNNQADRAYMRIQRQRAYARVMEANRALVVAEQDVLLPDKKLGRTKRQNLARTRMARREFFAAVDLAYVVGPRDVLPSITTLFKAHGVAQRTIDKLGTDATRTSEQRRAYFNLIKDETRKASAMATQFRMAIDANGKCRTLIMPMACQLDWLALGPLP